jgi:hypothetical protein
VGVSEANLAAAHPEGSGEPSVQEAGYPEKRCAKSVCILRCNLVPANKRFFVAAVLALNLAPVTIESLFLAQFFAAGSAKPVTADTLLHILVRSPGELSNAVFEEKVVGVDWGDEIRSVSY